MKAKFTKEYAEQMADAWTSRDDTGWSDYKEGYLKAIEETAAPELLEACMYLTEYANKGKSIDDFDDDELKAHRLAIQAIQKATQP